MTDTVQQAPASVSPFEPGSLLVLVLRPDGEPIPQASITLQRGELVTLQKATDKGGSALFDKLTPGTYTVSVAAGGMGRAPKPGQPFKPGIATDTAIVAPGPEESDFTFQMTLPVGFLNVDVRDKGGKVLGKIPVEILGSITKDTEPNGIARFGPQATGISIPILAGQKGKPTTKPFFSHSPTAPDPVKFQPVESNAILSIGEVRTVPVRLEEFRLQIVKIDDHFAPSVENLDIRYSIRGLAKRKVVLTIEGDNYPGKTLVQRDLGEGESNDGDNNLISFTGKIEVGANKDGFINPLMGPFRVRLSHDDADHFDVLKDEKPFKVLYHSIELSFGKHTADETTPDESADQIKFMQERLNALNYDAGAVNGVFGTVMPRALRRFQRANYQVGTQTRLIENGIIDTPTKAAIKVAKAREIFEKGKTPLTQDAKFYVYDNYFNDRGASFAAGSCPEMGPPYNRRPFAEDKMDRAFIPLEVEVKIVNKAGNGVSAPAAVGPAPIAWEVADTPEDSSVIPDPANATAKTFVKHAREIGTSGTIAGAARIDQNGDNALDSLGGMRNTADATYIQAWFPNSAESVLDPYSIARYDTEDRGGKTFHRAVVAAWDHPTNHPKRRGRAGIYFRMSIVGGDTAKVSARITFKGLPNKDTLEKDHASFLKNLVKETGTWTVWRRTRISAYCQMVAPRRSSGSPDWATIVGRYKQAFIEFENDGKPLRDSLAGSFPSYSTVVTSAAYSTAILALPAAQRPVGVTNAASLTYRADCIYGGVFPPRDQTSIETAFEYASDMGTLMAQWAVAALNVILELVYLEARKVSPEGYVILDFRTHPPISGKDWNPALAGGVGDFQATANPAARNYIDPYRGFDLIDGAVTMSVDNPFDVNCYLAHECGHARYLQHHKFVDLTEASPFGTSAHDTHHDADQDRCIMSYTKPPDTPAQWTYHFCGKCILRMRGWDVTALPLKYA